MKKNRFAMAFALVAFCVTVQSLNAQTQATPEPTIPDAVTSSSMFAVTVRFETMSSDNPSEATPLTHEQPGMTFGNSRVLTAVPPDEITNNAVAPAITIVQGEREIPVTEFPVAYRTPSEKMVMSLVPSRKLEAPTEARIAQSFEELFLVTPKGVVRIPPPLDEAQQYVGALIVNERGELWGIATWSWWKESPAYNTVFFTEILSFLAGGSHHHQEPDAQPTDPPPTKIRLLTI